MKILGYVLAVLYGALMIFAVCKDRSKNVSSALILIGGTLTGIYVLSSALLVQNLILVLIAGMICISAGTLMNGLKQKNVHIQHHIIRLIIETILVAICWLAG